MVYLTLHLDKAIVRNRVGKFEFTQVKKWLFRKGWKIPCLWSIY